MTVEQFWDGDCTLVKAFRKADKYRLERQNTLLWLQGQYIYEALLDASPILRAFAKKGAKPVPYRSEPYPITREAVEDKEEQDAKKVFDKGKDYLKAFMKQTKKKKTEEVTDNG